MGLPNFQKCVLLALKCDFFGEKIQKNHNFSVSTLLDIRGSILDTLRYCEKFRDLGFRLILDTIFSRLVGSSVVVE